MAEAKSAQHRLNACFFAYLLFVNQFCLVAMEETTANKKEYMLNPEYLGLLYHRASSNTLLHGKAKRELANLPKTEKILFDECANASKNVLQLAKCVAAVLDARDNLKVFKPKPSDPECAPDESDGNWVMGLVRGIYRKWNCQDGLQHSLTEQKQNSTKIVGKIKVNKIDEEIPPKPNKYTTKQSANQLRFVEKSNNNIGLKRRQFYSIWRQNRHKNRLNIAPSQPSRNQPKSLYTTKQILSPLTQQQIDQKFQPNRIAQIKHENSILRRLGLKSPLQIEKLPPIDSMKQKRLNKRSLKDISPRCLVPKNVEKLRSVRGQFDKLNHVLKYIYEVTKSNQQFFEEADSMKIEYRERVPPKYSPLRQAREFAEKLETFEDRDIVNILSPKLLNLMPENPMDANSKNWMSPNMLSFQDEGMLPLPRLLQMSISDHCETMKWIDLLMDMTGANRMFKDVDKMFGSFMNDVDETLYPRIQDVKVHDKKFEKLQELTSFEQKRQMDDQGYVLMNEDQMRMVYGKEGIMESPNRTEFSTSEDLEQVFEHEIRLLSKMTDKEFLNAHKKYHEASNQQHRHKRQAPPQKNILDVLLPMTTQQQVLGIRVLNPFSFTTRIRNANIMGPYILSPFAFYLQVISPTLLHMEIMSPRAFIATTFSPLVLTVRVLSPSAFRLMLFSPLLLVVWVMVPEAFLAKIFAPKLLDARILSPESFSFILLSPAAGVLRAGSPNAMNMLVLSPSFGTYQIFSGNRYVVQVLSPGILGVDSHPILREAITPDGRPKIAGQPSLPGQVQSTATRIQTNQIQVNYGGREGQPYWYGINGRGR